MDIFIMVIVFTVGLVTGLVVFPKHKPTVRVVNRRQVQEDKLDDIDQMALWGIVNNDPFYQ